jgi:hypothetical protein
VSGIEKYIEGHRERWIEDWSSLLKQPMIKIPYGNHDQNNHALNENLSVECLLRGVRTTTALFFEMAG